MVVYILQYTSAHEREIIKIHQVRPHSALQRHPRSPDDCADCAWGLVCVFIIHTNTI